MTGLEDLFIVLSDVVLPKLEPLDIGALLLTSKRLYTAISPTMETIYKALFPNEPLDPNAPRNKSYWTRRFLARTKASQVYVWGHNSHNRLCLSRTRKKSRKKFMNRNVYWPTRSEFLSRLCVSKFKFGRSFNVALSMNGKVYIIPKNYGEFELVALECECPNEFMVDVDVSESDIVALSDTARLYTCDLHPIEQRPSPKKLVEVDLKGELGLANKPRILAIACCPWMAFMCLVEDVGVVMKKAFGYPPIKPVIIPRVSNSIDPGWDVVDMALSPSMSFRLVILLRNGLVYDVFPLKRPSPPRPELLPLPEPIERIWCNTDRLLALSRTKVLFQMDSNDTRVESEDYESTVPFTYYEPHEVEGIDAAHISSIAIGDLHNIALMDDGTLYVWGENNYYSTHALFGLGPRQPSELWEAVKIDLKHAVYVSIDEGVSAVITMNLNEPRETAAAS